MPDFQQVLTARQDDANWQRQQISFDDLSGAAAIRGLQFWNELRGERPYPARSKIQPRQIAPILRNVLLLRVLGGGEEFEYRIVGDVVIQLHGAWLPGSTTADVDAHFPGYGRVIKRVYQHVCRSGEALALRGEVERQSRDGANSGRLFAHESVFLPLGETDGAVDHIMVVCDVISSKLAVQQSSPPSSEI